MAEENKEPVYEKPTSQLDLEARQQEDWRPATQLTHGEYDNSALNRGGFVGVDPVYQNAGTEAQRPMHADGGPEAVVEEAAGVVEGNEWKGDEAIPEVDPESDPLVADETVATGDNAPTPAGKASDESKSGTTAKKATSAPKTNQPSNKE